MEVQNTLQVGNIVRLKSGGPDMTVVSPQITFVYVTYDGLEGQQESFPIHSLKKISNGHR